jgi:hypothetical protein
MSNPSNFKNDNNEDLLPFRTPIAQINSASQVSGLLGMKQSLIVFNIHQKRNDDLYFPHLLKKQRNTPSWYPIAATNL